MREAVLKLTMDYKMTKHVLNNGTLAESRTWLLVITWHCYFISFNSEHPVDCMIDMYGNEVGNIDVPHAESLVIKYFTSSAYLSTCQFSFASPMP